MRSLIIIEVEHGEDTDQFDAFATYIADDTLTDHRVTVRDYAIRVDLPPYMTAVNINAIIDRGTG